MTTLDADKARRRRQRLRRLRAAMVSVGSPKGPLAAEQSTPARRALFAKGLKAAPLVPADSRCAGCRRGVHLAADVGQRVGIRCLYCWRVYCVVCAKMHFAVDVAEGTIRFTPVEIERGARAMESPFDVVRAVRFIVEPHGVTASRGDPGIYAGEEAALAENQ